MKFIGSRAFRHDAAPCVGVLITNLGTPASCSTQDVRRYLREFLWDRRVIETPRWLWWLILHGVILPTRPRKSAAAYRKIWQPDGSPLLQISVRQRDALRRQLRARSDGKITVAVELGMRYGTPCIADALKKLHAAGARRLVVLPLYPQYCAATTASTFDAVTAALSRYRWLPELRFINHYHDHPAYIAALAHSVREYRKQHGRSEMLVFSFHGIPQSYFADGDPYHCECHKTARLLAEKLRLREGSWRVSFQSRLGPKAWLQPYTDAVLQQLAQDGCRSVQVICPGFSADCLETLEEIGMQNRDLFLAHGGARFDYIPCLNDSPAHIDALGKLLKLHAGDWLHAAPPNQTELKVRAQRAQKMESPNCG